MRPIFNSDKEREKAELRLKNAAKKESGAEKYPTNKFTVKLFRLWIRKSASEFDLGSTMNG